MEILLITGGVLLLLAGLVFSILPPLPGPPIAWGALLLLRWHPGVEEPAWGWTAWLLLWLAVAVASTFMDNVLAVWGTRLSGGSKAGTWGAFIGLLVGLIFLGPILGLFSIVVGPFAGAFLAELAQGKNADMALRSGLGSLAGLMAGTLLKLGISIFFVFAWIRLLL
jgi:uncharacterized protein YqgC (DUF456 family)